MLHRQVLVCSQFPALPAGARRLVTGCSSSDTAAFACRCLRQPCSQGAAPLSEPRTPLPPSLKVPLPVCPLPGAPCRVTQSPRSDRGRASGQPQLPNPDSKGTVNALQPRPFSGPKSLGPSPGRALLRAHTSLTTHDTVSTAAAQGTHGLAPFQLNSSLALT